jgi:hypothetical protein
MPRADARTHLEREKKSPEIYSTSEGKKIHRINTSPRGPAGTHPKVSTLPGNPNKCSLFTFIYIYISPVYKPQAISV